MKTTACIAVIGLMAVVSCDIATTDTLLVENETAFLKRCSEEVLHARPDATTWVDKHCATRWRRVENSVPIVEAILALAPKSPGVVQSSREIRARLPAVQWSPDGKTGVLNEMNVYLQATGNGITFYWQKQSSEAPYNIIDALRIRGITLRTLGCPQYPGASMGREKVITGQLEGRPSFVLTVYSRPAPTGIDQAIYQVDVDFSGKIPDMAALRAGHYPGGGDRAFAVDPSGWKADCADPE
jgi:hypothetical protein|tara:strand:- start:479 stop:1201 length:723 start_codon:yes stop_codon:yes gene_type:complete